jgi:hypothetical protein
MGSTRIEGVARLVFAHDLLLVGFGLMTCPGSNKRFDVQERVPHSRATRLAIAIEKPASPL